MILEKYLYALKFFTTWCLILALLHIYTRKYINLLFITFITAMTGLYLSFINPRKFVFYFENKRYVYTGAQKFIIVDMLFHILVFYLIYTRYKDFFKDMTDTRTLNAVLLLFLYASVTNFKKLYGVNLIELLCVFIISSIFYYLLFQRK